ncbi:FUSC family protein [Micromonospora sp. WMMD1102]|uniref:FUSC family protein n=1 Tax=Micromonospora sp. WMMD1102 TaxID=3016105 RepID=UPI00241524A1|nr:FUSC family protein [Micromonospora sp. WMMD1102]MDG4786874.1 FUSC family protein [Micromonospora sp. WMMD1102]
MGVLRALRRHAAPATDADGRRISAALAELGRRGQRSAAARLRRLRTYLVLAVQAGLAAALAWLISHELLRTSEPVFAPVIAVAVIATSIDRRLRRSVELLVGVTVGIGVGDLLIAGTGTGPWQIGVIVALAIMVAILLRGSSSLITQAGGTAVLIASLTPTTQDLEVPRFVNAGIGGAVGLSVALLLLPLHPLRLVRRRANPLFELFTSQLAATTRALRNRDARQAQDALRALTQDTQLRQLHEALQAAREVVTYSPFRWNRRGTLIQYEEGAEHMERAFRDSRGLVRRIASLIRDGEPVPDALPGAVGRLCSALRLLHRDLSAGREPDRTREETLWVVTEAARATEAGLGFHGTAAVAQLRTMAHDLLRATGLDRSDARTLIRRTFAAARAR